MLTDTQRDVLRRLAEGGYLEPDVATCGEPYVVVISVPLSTSDADTLDAAGLIEVTLWHDGPRMYEITAAGRAALGEGREEGE